MFFGVVIEALAKVRPSTERSSSRQWLLGFRPCDDCAAGQRDLAASHVDDVLQTEGTVQHDVVHGGGRRTLQGGGAVN